jgi:DhnA family fructose-bisphosphate aldolase class Ia
MTVWRWASKGLRTDEGDMNQKRRMAHIFSRDGNALLVAMDHAILEGPMPGLVDPGKTLRSIIRGGADAVMTTMGVAQHFRSELEGVGLILRMDGGVTRYGDLGRIQPIHTLDDALRIGADGVAAMGFPGHPNEAMILGYLAQIIGEAHAWGMPVMAEMLPGDPEMCDGVLGRQIAAVARIGAELGADFIKTMYCGDEKSFRKVVEGCYVPVLILGGVKKDTDKEVLSMVKSAMDAGGRGVAMGRNVWQHDNPEKFVRALSAIIHSGSDVGTAYEVLQ